MTGARRALELICVQRSSERKCLLRYRRLLPLPTGRVSTLVSGWTYQWLLNGYRIGIRKSLSSSMSLFARMPPGQKHAMYRRPLLTIRATFRMMQLLLRKIFFVRGRFRIQNWMRQRWRKCECKCQLCQCVITHSLWQYCYKAYFGSTLLMFQHMCANIYQPWLQLNFLVVLSYNFGYSYEIVHSLINQCMLENGLALSHVLCWCNMSQWECDIVVQIFMSTWLPSYLAEQFHTSLPEFFHYLMDVFPSYTLYK